MAFEKRLEKIEQAINQEGFISTRELASRFHVTETTIRRNCEELEKQGKAIRVHGGVKSVSQKQILSPIRDRNMWERSLTTPEKEAAARKAASFVKDGDCIFIDSGTSAAAMLKYLQNKKIKIITNSHLLINAAPLAEAQVYMLGGWYSPSYKINFGGLVIEQLDFFNFDCAFLSCSGLDPAGEIAYTAETESAEIKRKAASRSIHKILLAEGEKIGVRGLFNALHTDKMDAVICAVRKNDSLEESELPDNFILVEADETLLHPDMQMKAAKLEAADTPAIVSGSKPF